MNPSWLTPFIMWSILTPLWSAVVMIQRENWTWKLVKALDTTIRVQWLSVLRVQKLKAKWVAQNAFDIYTSVLVQFEFSLFYRWHIAINAIIGALWTFITKDSNESQNKVLENEPCWDWPKNFRQRFFHSFWNCQWSFKRLLRIVWTVLDKLSPSIVEKASFGLAKEEMNVCYALYTCAITFRHPTNESQG